MRLRLGLAASAAILYAAPALAVIDPPPASDADARMRIVQYDPNNPVELTAAPGATLRIQLGADETVTGVIVSDQGTIAPGFDPAPPTGFVAISNGLSSSASRGPSSCDPNLCRSVIANFVYLKPLRELDPQPVFIQTTRINAYGKPEATSYTIELLTRPGDLKAATPHTTWGVTFAYPDRTRVVQLVAWRKRKAAQEAAAAARLALTPPSAAVPMPAANWRYGYRGSAVVEPDEVWDDGRTTFLRYTGNRRVPNIYRRLPDGHESIPAYSSEPDAKGTTLRIGRTETKWFVRDGDEAGCLFDLGPDPHGATFMTVAEPVQPGGAR